MTKFVLYTTLAVVVLVRSAAAQVTGSHGPLTAVRYSTVAMGVNSAIAQHERMVISNQAAWEAYYAKMAGDKVIGQRPVPRLCDFNRQDLVIIHTGRRATAGYSVYVSMIRLEYNKPWVEYVETRPPANAIVAQMITSPYVIVAVDRPVGEYNFRGSIGVTQFTPSGGSACHCTCACCVGGHAHGGQSRQGSVGFAPELFPPRGNSGLGGGHGSMVQ
ncbi:protease complex subunit PrcB family protein [Kamptonema cortianum]|nr:protease complex subunit PrcB family protein [Kamptonema cortianum]